MSFFIKVLLTITANYGIFAPFLPLFKNRSDFERLV
nr:MAG TPA: hypothetical protein [Caudoviricetes sp.]